MRGALREQVGRRFRRRERAHSVALADGTTLPVVVRRDRRARRLILRLARDGSDLRLTAPPSVGDERIAAFLATNRDWVARQLHARPSPVRARPGAVIPLRGVETRLAGDPGLRRARLDRGDGETGGETGGETAVEAARAAQTLTLGGDPAHFARRCADHLKREARADLQAAVNHHAGILGIAPAALTLRDTRSRWGSCSAERRLSFSWRIVMAPPWVLDYLVAHEVAHLQEMNHGADFWTLCRRLCPQTDAGRDWLRREGGRLQAIDFAPPAV